MNLSKSIREESREGLFFLFRIGANLLSYAAQQNIHLFVEYARKLRRENIIFLSTHTKTSLVKCSAGII
jgi:hypothetical protein